MQYKKIGIIADSSESAKKALKAIKAEYLNFIDIEKSKEAVDVVIALGGDGFMIRSMHRFMDDNVPIYGMNCGTVGFLLNSYNVEDLVHRINSAEGTKIHPLIMSAIDVEGNCHTALALNEVSLLRETKQSAKIRILVNEVEKLHELVADGVLVATPAGSSAYNFSVHGPILPAISNLLALTPISPFRPRHWRGALLPSKSKIKFEILESAKRPVSAVADFHEVRNVVAVEISENRRKHITLLFDGGNSLDEKIIREQFLY
jgi:NAD+ kinase